jgi:hypothetical protein
MKELTWDPSRLPERFGKALYEREECEAPEGFDGLVCHGEALLLDCEAEALLAWFADLPGWKPGTVTVRPRPAEWTLTDAPACYDGFGTRTARVLVLPPDGWHGNGRGGPVREVETPKEHVEWQRSRYSSGLYAWEPTEPGKAASGLTIRVV